MATTYTVSQLVQDARAYSELVPVLGESGFTQQPALQLANTVMQTFLGQSLDWKFNRSYIPPILTVGLQQDYVTSVTDLSWLEQGWRIDINNSVNNGNQGPKPVIMMETVRDLGQTSFQANPFNISWLPNNLAVLGVWTANTIIPTGYGQQQTPTSPIQQFLDNNGNILFLDSTVLGLNLESPGFSGNIITPNPNPYGTTGSVKPALPPNSFANITASSLTANVATITAANNFSSGNTFSIRGSYNGGGIFNVYNQTILTASATQFTFALTSTTNIAQSNDSGTVGLTVLDGSVVWTVANPLGIAIRIVPLPALNGLCWLVQPVYQKKPPILTSLQQTLTPIPDEYVYMFREGFLALCFEHADSKRFAGKYLEWKESITTALRSGDREREDAVFYPSSGLTGDSPWARGLPCGPAWPFSYFGY